MSANEALLAQFDYYLENQAEFVEKYNGKVIVLKDFKVIGVYETTPEAVARTKDAGHELGTFIVQRVSPGPEAYTIHLSTPNLISP